MKGIKIRVCEDCPYWYVGEVGAGMGDNYVDVDVDLCGHESVSGKAFGDRGVQSEKEPPKWCPLEELK